MANRQFFTTSCLIIPSYKPHFFAWKIRLIQDTLVDSMISSPFERVTFYETVQVNAKAAEIHQRLEHFQYSYFELSLDVMEHYKVWGSMISTLFFVFTWRASTQIYPKPGHKKKLPPPSKLRPFLFRTSKEARILTIDQAGETSCPTFAFLLLFNHSLDLLFLHSYTVCPCGQPWDFAYEFSEEMLEMVTQRSCHWFCFVVCFGRPFPLFCPAVTSFIYRINLCLYS